VEVDGFTVAAQLINFALLVWLLKKVLYAPVLAAMERRRARIEAAQEEARAARAEAERLASDYQQKLASLEALREQRQAELHSELEVQRRERLQAISAEAETAREAWRQRLDQERSQQDAALRGAIQERVLAVCRKALSDLADSDLESAMVRTLLARLRENPPDAATRQALATGCRIVTRAPLVAPLQEEIRRGIEAWAGESLPVRFEQTPDARAGLSLVLRDRRLGWSVDDYLDGLSELLPEAQGRA
jgi:F-type H+-transporting ATPase subunit b